MRAEGLLDFLTPFVEDARHSWSIGTFGAAAEFRRMSGEEAWRIDTPGGLAMVTGKGALKVTPCIDAEVIAYDTISNDGETWSQAVAVCAAFAADTPQVVTPLGVDRDAVQDAHRSHRLFDLGVGLGLVRFCVRTADAALEKALDRHAGRTVFGPGGDELMRAFLQAQPHRVLLSPLARIEVYQAIPTPDGSSPDGPHTHLLPKLLARQRTHSANTPIPEGLQSVLNLHPRAPWRDERGRRIEFDRAANAEFEALLARHALPEDARIRRQIEAAVVAGADPVDFAWPRTRRERVQARLTLRRLAATGRAREVAPWRVLYDRSGVENDLFDEEV